MRVASYMILNTLGLYLLTVIAGRIQNFRLGGGGANARGGTATERRVGMIEYSIGKLYFNSCTHTYSRHFRSINELIFKQVLA